jgi:hypothetical protein
VKGSWLMVEIESLDRGQLEAKTDEMGTVYIEWDEIAAISSPAIFDVRVESGEMRFF